MKRSKFKIALMGLGILISSLMINTGAKAVNFTDMGEDAGSILELKWLNGNNPDRPKDYGQFKSGAITKYPSDGTVRSYNSRYVFREKKWLTPTFGLHWYSPVGGKPGYSFIDSSKYVTTYADMLENRYFAYDYNPVNYNNINGRELFCTSSGNIGNTCNNFKSVATLPNTDVQFQQPTMRNTVGSKGMPYFNGKTGEWRYIGYSSAGVLLTNPIFPSDHRSGTNFWDYPWDKYPWNTGNPNVKKTQWDFEGSFEWNQKIEAIKDLSKSYKQILNKRSASQWAYYWSLKTNPEFDNPIFVGTRMNGVRYRTVIGPASDALMKDQDLELTKLEVIDKDTNQVIGVATRNGDSFIMNTSAKVVPGYAYTVRSTVKNLGDKPTKLENNGAKLSKVRVGYAINYNAGLDDTKTGFSNNIYNNDVVNYTVINPNQSITMDTTMVVPDETTTAFRVTSMIHNDHNVAGDNTYFGNDALKLIFKIDVGDIGTENIVLVDRAGNETNRIIPGKEYKIRYKVRYSGPDIKYWKPVWKTYSGCSTYTDANGNSQESCWSYTVDEGYWVYPEFLAKLDATIERYYTGINKEKKYTKLTDTLGSHVILNGQRFVFETDYMMLEIPTLYTIATIDPSSVQGADSDYTNDSFWKRWADRYDISVTNVDIIPKDERPIDVNKIKVGLRFDVKLSAPGYVNDYQKEVQFNANVGGQYFDLGTQLIRKGDNQNITREVTINVVPGQQMHIDATVFANPASYVWEYSNGKNVIGNNVFTTTGTVSSAQTGMNVINPTNPAIMYGKNNENRWNTVYKIERSKAPYVTYPLFNGGTKSFYDFYKVNYNTKAVSNTESYNITDIKFKSKMTQDLNKGVNGWVSLFNEEGLIKAGYGYELEITVKYQTDAYRNEPKESKSYGSKADITTVLPQNVGNNFFKDIYVKTDDGKIYSVSGIYNTIQALQAKVIKETKDEVEVKYTIKPKDTFGVKEASKIFISPETKDGKYTLEVFTPHLNGVPELNKPKLYDRKVVKFEVRGSATDDVNTHTSQ